MCRKRKSKNICFIHILRCIRLYAEQLSFLFRYLVTLFLMFFISDLCAFEFSWSWCSYLPLYTIDFFTWFYLFFRLFIHFYFYIFHILQFFLFFLFLFISRLSLNLFVLYFSLLLCFVLSSEFDSVSRWVRDLGWILRSTDVLCMGKYVRTMCLFLCFLVWLSDCLVGCSTYCFYCFELLFVFICAVIMFDCLFVSLFVWLFVRMFVCLFVIFLLIFFLTFWFLSPNIYLAFTLHILFYYLHVSLLSFSLLKLNNIF